MLLRGLRWLPLGLALPFLVLLPQARGLGLGEVGVLFGVHSAVAILFEVPSGGLADAIGRRAALIAGGVVTVLSLAAFAVATGFAGFAAAVAALAAGRALMSGALEAWFVDELRLLDPEAALHAPLAAGSTAEGIGSGAGAALGGFLPLLPLGLDERGDALLVQLSLPLAGAALAALVYVVVLAALVAETPRPRESGARAIAAETRALTRAGFGVARRSRNVRLLLGVIGAIGIVMSMTEVLWPTRLNELLDTDATAASPLFGLLAAASLAAFAVGSAVSPRVARRTSKRTAYAGSYVALAGALVLLGAVASTAPFCAAFLAYFAAIGVAEPLHYEALHDATGASTRATVVSIDGLVGQAGGLGGNVALVPLAAAAGFGVAWGAAAAIALVAAGLAAAVARPRPRPAAPSGGA